VWNQKNIYQKPKKYEACGKKESIPPWKKICPELASSMVVKAHKREKERRGTTDDEPTRGLSTVLRNVLEVVPTPLSELLFYIPNPLKNE
jgi:hypothetical protein